MFLLCVALFDREVLGCAALLELLKITVRFVYAMPFIVLVEDCLVVTGRYFLQRSYDVADVHLFMAVI